MSGDKSVMSAANGRSRKSGMPDEGVLPKSSMKPVEWTGIKDTGYLDKKGTPSGVTAMFNTLPPGMNIDDQELTDQREMPMKTITRMGYPGDGWEGS